MLLRRKKGRLEKGRGMETRFARLDAGSGDFDARNENREGFRFRVFSAGGFFEANAKLSCPERGLSVC
jgi:hypothetical protein